MLLPIITISSAKIDVVSPSTLVQLGDLGASSALLPTIAFFAMVAMYRLRVLGAILISIVAMSVLSTFIGLNTFSGIVSALPSLAPTFMQLDIASVFELGLISVVFAFLIVDLFDTTGTLFGVANRAELLDGTERLPRLHSALLADSLATVACAALGTSTTTTYIESAAGNRADGRTDPTAVVVSVLFLGCLFFAPFAGSVPAYATAPALQFVACMVARGLLEINWEKVTDYIFQRLSPYWQCSCLSRSRPKLALILLPMPQSKY